MEFQLYENSDVLLNNNSPNNTNSSWNIPNDHSMDNNDEYFAGWNSLKIDETNIDDCVNEKNNNTNRNIIENDGKCKIRKRKLSSSNSNDNNGLTTNNKMKTNLFKVDSLEDVNNHNQEIKKLSMQNGTARMSTWQVDDITDLNEDIDNSLNLGPDLSNNSFNDAILAIPGLTVFKQEAPSPTEQDGISALHHPQQQQQQQQQQPQLQQSQQQHQQHRNQQSSTSTSTQQVNGIDDHIVENTNQNIFNQLLNHSAYANLQNAIDVNLVTSQTQDYNNVSSTNYNFGEDCRFQYVLAAATSIATKINEDTITYLNQGQSYEIKLKKLGDLSMYRGKMLKSVIRICFHERRLQYMEKEQMMLWQNARPGDRILEVDVPLSYGAFDIIQPLNALNIINFTWDPTKEVGVYIKVNCISTEFTPKKHGGEKGVPFRIQVETYQNNDNFDSTLRLHAAACQIKVFKLKGADRKHKQDRDKIMKRPLSEQEKYQPSYECTVLNDIPNDAVLNSSPIIPVTQNECDTQNIGRIHQQQQKVNELTLKNDNVTSIQQCDKVDVVVIEKTSVLPLDQPNQNIDNQALTLYSTTEDTVNWLKRNRFDKYIPTFINFSGSDMLRMSREDLVQICGDADGIRLYNAVHLKPIAPKLKIYVCHENSSIYNAVFLSTYSQTELLHKLASLCEVSYELIGDIYLEGPQSIRVKLTNDIVCHMKEETMYSLEVSQENGKYIFLLKR